MTESVLLGNLDRRLLLKVAAGGETEYTVLRKASRLKPDTFKAAIERLMVAGTVNRRLLPTGSRYASWFSATAEGLQAIKAPPKPEKRLHGGNSKTSTEARRSAVKKQIKTLQAMKFKPAKPSAKILREIRDE